jgi:hypothetical protein
MEEAEKLRDVVKKSPEKAKKVHLYNQHQSPPPFGFSYPPSFST